MKFMCMAYEEEQELNELSATEWQALRQETLSYVERLKASGHLIAAHPLQSARTASTLRVRNGKVTITDPLKTACGARAAGRATWHR